MGKGTGKRGGEPANLYQRDGVWYARVQVGGREHRRSLQTRTRREAERRLTEYLRGVSPYHGTVRHTYKEAATLWLEACATEWTPKTARRYDQSLTVLEPYVGHLFWDQINRAILQDFIKARKAQGKTVATINRDLTVLSGIAKHVRYLDGWPDHNPVDTLPRKPRRENNAKYVRPPAEDIEAIFARMHGTFGDLCRFLLLTGMRLDEGAGLKRRDVVNGVARLHVTKNKRVRTVDLCSEAQAIVERQPAHITSPYLFVTRNGDRYKRVTEMWREVVLRAQKLAQKAGAEFTRMRLHDLRHEFAIRYLESGGSLYTLRDILGHGSIKQTEWYCDYLTPDQVARVKESPAQNPSHIRRFSEQAG